MSEKIYLYSEDEIARCPSKADVWLEAHTIGNNTQVCIVCPGGAYAFVSHSNEGLPFAQKLNEGGISAFVLNYRVGKDALYPNPFLDLARAVQYVRKNADKYAVNADKISIWGSSAGGHLCAYYAARYNEFAGKYEGENISTAVEACVLAYPVVTFLEGTHAGTRENLLGGNRTVEEYADKSVELIADKNYPATFSFHCRDDSSVPVSNTLRLMASLEKLGVRHEAAIYPQGGHGCGVADGTSAEGWTDRAVHFLLQCDK